MLAFDWKFNDKKNRYKSLDGITVLMRIGYFKSRDEPIANA